MAKAEVVVNGAAVYVVDDDDGMRRALSLLLNTVGYKTAASGRWKFTVRKSWKKWALGRWHTW
jgi:hypothetical protein